ncbi:hypothetical protein COCNU_10G002970 [Cocos nucifera]|uniref:Cyclin n=1 Tax=Cocos nucifera TaxID=13894 RepID=A0A8K0N805_COCNU|nr:hypothetical protein COCNU_10G002970 [Cocos nucifera]
MAELRREDPPRVVSVLSSVLRRVAELNDLAIHGRLAAPHHRASAFHVPRIPGISVHSYLERIFRHADCSPTCYVVAYVYLDRFTQRQPPVFINSLNVHRLLLTSILTAVKFRERISRGETAKRPNRKSWKQRTDMYMRPFMLNVFFSKRTIGQLIAERSMDADVFAMSYEPKKNERIEAFWICSGISDILQVGDQHKILGDKLIAK